MAGRGQLWPVVASRGQLWPVVAGRGQSWLVQLEAHAVGGCPPLTLLLTMALCCAHRQSLAQMTSERLHLQRLWVADGMGADAETTVKRWAELGEFCGRVEGGRKVEPEGPGAPHEPHRIN